MSDPFLGQITMFANYYAPNNWAFCSGAILPVNQHSALYSLLGTAYGGNGTSSFGIPNLISRMPVGSSDMGNNNTGLQQFVRGQMAGQQYKSLQNHELPSHTHAATFTPHDPTGNDVTVSVTTETGEKATPAAGDYLAQASDLPGQDKPEQIFKSSPTPSSLVNLGGVSGGGNTGGTVTIGNTGSGQHFSMVNPFTAVNFCISLAGTYPSHS